jgi:hypothetical protein
MKRKTIFLLALAALLMLSVAVQADVTAGQGLDRVEAAKGYEQAEVLAARLGVGLTDGVPLYTPTHAQPLNAYMVVDPQCEVGIDRDDMYPVSEKGLIPEITDCLDRWIDDIQQASAGAIRFVADPNDADILVGVRQSFKRYGEYSGGGMSAEGYSCTVRLTARQLSDTDNSVSFAQTSDPQETVTLRGDGRFWKTPPRLTDGDGLTAFVNAIMGWYGYDAQKGSNGAAVKRVQQSLIQRGFLGGSADGSFGPRTEGAIMALQEAYSLEKTGVIDGRTLLAVYYDHAAVDALPE